MHDPDARGFTSFLKRVFALAHARSLVCVPFIGAIPDRRLVQWLDPSNTHRLGRAPGSGTHGNADVLVVIGRVPQKLAPTLQRTHAALAHPALVVHVDVAPDFPGNYALIEHLGDVVPIDITVRDAAPSEVVIARCAEALETIIMRRRVESL